MMAATLPIGGFDGNELITAPFFFDESMWLRAPKQLTRERPQIESDVH